MLGVVLSFIIICLILIYIKKGRNNMFKRLRRIFNAEGNALIDKLEAPIKIMEQVISDSKEEIFKLYTSFEDINKSIEKLSSMKVSKEMQDTIIQQKEKMEKLRDNLKGEIEKYKEKVISTQNKIIYLREKNSVFDSILKIQENVSKLNIDSDMSAIERMEEKINKKESLLNAYDYMEDM